MTSKNKNSNYKKINKKASNNVTHFALSVNEVKVRLTKTLI